ncbi:ribonuclease H-like domain-containing protein [Tanacetum coccineum]|uniref:Ribonuclease H-like domain-containing protein n=1 Tax=Tanacetum coccineum TaxID=301880 RepID=A0ABQ4YSL9_9ASTR
MSFDDLYNNFKIVEQEVKGTASSSSSSSSQNMAFVSSPSSTNEVNTAYGVSTANTQVSPASTQVSTASTQVSTANLSDDTVYAFLASQPNGSQLVYEDLEQIHEDDIEEMDLKWQLALLSMRTRRWSVSICTRWGYLQWECRGPRNQDSRNMNQDSSRRTVNVEETSSKAMIEFNKSEFHLATYKRRLASVEEQLVFYKKNELEKLKQEKESNQLKIENFDNASKSLDKLIGSQITDKSRKGVGFVSYNVVPPPHTGLFSPPNLDLSYSGLEEFQQPEFEGYGPKPSKSVSEDISNEVRESPDAPLVEELVSDDKLEKKTVFPTVAKIEFVRPKQQEKPVRKPVKYAEMYSFDHVQANCNYHQRERVVSENNYTRVNYNYSAKVSPSAHRQKAVNIARLNSAVVNDVRANLVNAVKASACWVWRPTKLNSHPQKEDQGYVDSGCSRHMTGNMSYISNFKEFDGGYVTFVGGAKGGKITGKGTLKTADESHVLLKVHRKNNMYSVDMKNIFPKESLTCLVAKATLDESMLWHRMLGHAEAVNTACYVQNRVIIVKPHNKTPYELFRGRTPALSFMRPFGCHVTILNTLDHLGKFDGKFDDGFFVGYSLTSKAFRVYNIRTRKVEENLHIRFLKNKPIVTSDDSEESNDAGHTSKETKFSQNYIVMPLWKDGSMFDSSSENSSEDEPQPSSNAEKKDDEGGTLPMTAEVLATLMLLILRGTIWQFPRGMVVLNVELQDISREIVQKLKNKDGGNGNAQGWVYAVGNAEKNGNASRNPDSNVVTASLETISAIEMLLGMERDCQHGIYTTGGVSRVDEMILARERSGFAGKKYGATYKL